MGNLKETEQMEILSYQESILQCRMFFNAQDIRDLRMVSKDERLLDISSIIGMIGLTILTYSERNNRSIMAHIHVFGDLLDIGMDCMVLLNGCLFLYFYSS